MTKEGRRATGTRDDKTHVFGLTCSTLAAMVKPMRFEVGSKIELRLQPPLEEALNRHAERLFPGSKHGRPPAARRLLRDALIQAELETGDTRTVWVILLDQPAPQMWGEEWGVASGYVPSIDEQVSEWLCQAISDDDTETYAMLSPYDDSVDWEIQSREFTVARSEWEALAWALENPDELHDRPWP